MSSGRSRENTAESRFFHPGDPKKSNWKCELLGGSKNVDYLEREVGFHSNYSILYCSDWPKIYYPINKQIDKQ